MVDEPRGYIHTGGATAAPLFAKVAAAALARDGILTEPELPLPEWARVDWVPPWKTSTKKPAPAKRAPKVVAAAKPAKRVMEPPRNGARARPAAQQAEHSPARSEAPQSVASREPSGVTSLGGRVLVPDFRGQTPEQVRAQLAGNGIRLQASGSGRAVAQDPGPGTIVRGGSIRVRFGVGGSGR